LRLLNVSRKSQYDWIKLIHKQGSLGYIPKFELQLILESMWNYSNSYSTVGSGNDVYNYSVVRLQIN
jgi:hypothetical protein